MPTLSPSQQIILIPQTKTRLKRHPHQAHKEKKNFHRKERNQNKYNKKYASDQHSAKRRWKISKRVLLISSVKKEDKLDSLKKKKPKSIEKMNPK